VDDVSKKHPGGLKGRNITPKVVLHHANTDRPDRCFVRLFKRYCDLCPKDAPPHAFYLRPAQHPTAECWYSRAPLGHTTLANTVSRICKLAGIEGYKTNHSLRATATSRLYQAGVDEQLVMERTGHRSLEGVRSYKRTSDTQREALSDILNCRSKRCRVDDTVQQCPNTTTDVQSSSGATIFSNNQHSQELWALSHLSAVFNNCTVNIYVGTPLKRRRKEDSHPGQLGLRLDS